MTLRIPDLAEVAAQDPRGSLSAADPCTIVIFGASGDLTRRKLIPALYELACHKSLARRFAIIGFARSAMSDDAFRASAAESVRKFGESGPVDEEELRSFAQSFAYVAGDDDSQPQYLPCRRRHAGSHSRGRGAPGYDKRGQRWSHLLTLQPELWGQGLFFGDVSQQDHRDKERLLGQ